jgi:hypothetical protein
LWIDEVVDRRVWDADEEYGDAEEVLEGAGTSFIMSPPLREIAHQYVLTNISLLEPWHRWVCSIAVIFW